MNDAKEEFINAHANNEKGKLNRSEIYEFALNVITKVLLNNFIMIDESNILEKVVQHIAVKGHDLSFEEFWEVYDPLTSEEQDDVLKRFKEMDTNKNGFLGASEF